MPQEELFTEAEMAPAPDKIDLAYAAGLFDGEGSISIVSYTNRERGYFKLDVRVANTDKAVVEWLSIMFGGYLSVQKRTDETHKVVYRWAIADRGAGRFLRLIYPYLKIKRLRAEMAINFRETYDRGVVVGGSVVEYREKLYEQMRIANKRGPTEEVIDECE
jgi:hypothetical protein